MKVPARSLCIGLAGPQLMPEEQAWLRHPAVGTVILFARNYQHPEQLEQLTRAIRQTRGDLIICVDQEGGRVQRFREGFFPLPPLAVLGQCWDADRVAARELARAHAWVMASEIVAHGCDFSFAPVLDLGRNKEVIGDRAFHPQPEAVAQLAEAWLGGLKLAGVQAVGKHFPGHGSVAGDSHHTLPEDPRPLEQIRETDLPPFAHAFAHGLAGVMMAHVRYPAVDALPAGYSRRWVRAMLREELGFAGLVFSDDLAMAGAGDAPLAERVAHSLAAGCQVLLLCFPEQVAEAMARVEVDEQAEAVPIGRMRRRVSIDPGRLRQSAMWAKYTAMLQAHSAR